MEERSNKETMKHLGRRNDVRRMLGKAGISRGAVGVVPFLELVLRQAAISALPVVRSCCSVPPRPEALHT